MQQEQKSKNESKPISFILNFYLIYKYYNCFDDFK